MVTYLVFYYPDGAFGLMNEMGVGMAESTCTAKITGALPRSKGGAALWYTDSLSRVALERTSTARDAVLLMGQLAVNDGFYADSEFEGTGESLIVVDKKEVWVFHILASDSNGKDIIWITKLTDLRNFARVYSFSLKDLLSPL